MGLFRSWRWAKPGCEVASQPKWPKDPLRLIKRKIGAAVDQGSRLPCLIWQHSPLRCRGSRPPFKSFGLVQCRQPFFAARLFQLTFLFDLVAVAPRCRGALPAGLFCVRPLARLEELSKESARGSVSVKIRAVWPIAGVARSSSRAMPAKLLLGLVAVTSPWHCRVTLQGGFLSRSSLAIR